MSSNELDQGSFADVDPEWPPATTLAERVTTRLGDIRSALACSSLCNPKVRVERNKIVVNFTKASNLDDIKDFLLENSDILQGGNLRNRYMFGTLTGYQIIVQVS